MTFEVGSYTFTNTGTATNFQRKTFDVFTITEPTDVILKQGGDENCGIDLVWIQRIEQEPQFIAQFTPSDSTLTFKKGFLTSSSSYTWDASSTNLSSPKWLSYRNYISKVVFDESFSEARPTSCYAWFYQFANLKDIEGIENLNTSEVTSMAYMFNQCTSLSSIDVSGFNTSKVTSMYYMFRLCNLLTTLDVSNFDTSNVTDMGWMFCGCTGLNRLDLYNFNTSDVTDMNNMFYGCYKLKEVDVSHFDTSNVTDMTSMFSCCNSLTSLDLSSFRTTSLAKIEYMFWNCQDLSTIMVSSAWTIDSVNKADSVFYSCYNLIGGAGTSYDESRIDYSYAHIDLGTDDPGYFTLKAPQPSLKGDVNGDQRVDVADIASIIDFIAGRRNVDKTTADVNDDGMVDVADIATIINIMATSTTRMSKERSFHSFTNLRSKGGKEGFCLEGRTGDKGPIAEVIARLIDIKRACAAVF